MKTWFRDDQQANKGTCGTEEICETYSTEGYGSMNDDLVRNDCYRKAIREICKGGDSFWIEIGCGGDALLTRMVTESPGGNICALEINSSSAARARQYLRDEIRQGRAVVVTGSSFDAAVVREVADAAATGKNGTIGYVLHEVFGFFVSSEGAPCIISHLLKCYPGVKEDSKFLPGKAATFLVPSCIDPQQDLMEKNELYVSEKLILRKRLDFKACRLSPTSSALEFYDFNKNFALKQERTHVFAVSRDGLLNSLSFFIWVDFDIEVRDRAVSLFLPPTSSLHLLLTDTDV